MDTSHGINVIDTGYQRPGFAASHLIIEKGIAAFVDVGTAFSVPRLLGALDAKGVRREDVAFVLVTHVHLDHAGGAGQIMQQLPNARLVVHPRGARHMIDPEKLIAGATAVYGEKRFRADYGEIVPVPAARVMQAPDGFTLDFNGRSLVFLDTPGHARHHYCIYDEQSAGVFAGDTFGLSYREFDSDRGAFIFPTTSPVQFDPGAMHRSVERLLALRPQRMYLTHYGCVTDVVRLGSDLRGMIDSFVALAQGVKDRGAQRHALLVAGLSRLLWDALQGHGSRIDKARAMALLALDLELNAQGLEVWLDSQKKQE